MPRKMSRNQQKAMFSRINSLNLKSNNLPVQFAIVVPSTTEKDKQLSSALFKKRVDSEKKFFSQTFGGDTSIKATGSFILKEKGKTTLIKEPVVLIEGSTTPKVYMKSRVVLENHVKTLPKKWSQNSVLYKVEGNNYIYPKQSLKLTGIPSAPDRKIIIS